MATPIHPNEFALRQHVLFREADDPRWREGTITAISIDQTKTRDRHGDGCDEHQYVIADDAHQTMLREERERRTVTGCLCEVMVADADATGRWNGQLLGGAKGLALLLVDAKARGDHLTPVWVESYSGSDEICLQTNVGDPRRTAVTQARVAVDDLIAWASGIPAAEWKEPIE